MKNIKLLSVVALAIFGATAASTVVSADPLLDQQTGSSIEFDNDTTSIVTPTDPEEPGKPLPPTVDPTHPIVINPVPSGALAIAGQPDGFDFGSHKIGAADIFGGGIKTYAQVDRPNETRKQGLEIHDGRIDKDDWTLTAQLSAFDSGKLTGSTITIENVKTLSQFTGQEPLLVQGATTTISQTSAVDFMKADPKAKGDTSAIWDNFSDVKIHVPASEITKGAHNATVDWTLVAGAN
ncbi:hypothetical protein FACS1894192_03540 [Bacilli bacterium]|nr:hypothetical protein FACS1894192_03540 [Bacilli bacterium]